MTSTRGRTSKAASVIATELSMATLRQTASWIRDVLDPMVSREGPLSLDPNDVLKLHGILLDLQTEPVSVHMLRSSRIFLAVRDICGKATRWPARLVDEADELAEAWTEEMGPLKNIRTPLYEKGGRLHGLCEPYHTEKDDLFHHFGSQNPKIIDNNRAYIHGGLGFKIGTWWINGLFAFRDGIINSLCTDGGIVHTKDGAYAIVLKGDDEDNAFHPSKFTYRCRIGDKGRFRLTTANFRSRYSIRVLRDHRLVSHWAPRTGIRYDGLYKVVGWTIKPCDPRLNDGESVRFEIHFESAEVDADWDKIMARPLAEENDDYKMYKIIHHEQREYKKREARNIFESSFVLPEDSSSSAVVTRSMSISEIAGLGFLGLLTQSSISNAPLDEGTTSDSDHGEGKTPVDGTSDKTHPSPQLTRHDRRLAYFPGISRKHDASVVAAIEPFATLRKLIGRDRSSYDGSDDVHPAPRIDTRFRPINWNPAPRLNLRPALDVSDEDLEKIAPFSDLRRRRQSSGESTVPSPKTSITDLKMRQLVSRRRTSTSATIFEHGVDGTITSMLVHHDKAGSWT